MRRYDLYGFRGASLEQAAAFVERALGIRLMRRDSSYRGIYYRAGTGVRNDYLLQSNDENSRWRSAYPEYGVTLMVNDVQGMDAIREKLAAGGAEPSFLRSITQADDLPREPGTE